MSSSRRTFLGACALATWLTASAAFAAEKVPYSQAALSAAQAAGRPILVEITAPWCPTCKAQKPILSELMGQAKFQDLVVLEVDFDSQKEAVRKLGAQMQSTLIAYKGADEVGRSVGDTDPASIAALLDKTI
jgi:thiol-disulfide isomerase/thioredoxin